MIDLAGISGVAGVAAGAFDAICPVDAAIAGTGSGAAATAAGGLSGTATSLALAAVALTTGATAGAALWLGGGSALAGDAGADEAIAAGTTEADAGEEVTTGEEGAVAAAAFCRAIEPVTESRPCSSTVRREYNRSRSPLRVSMADASRRVSCWLSLATDWICCDCRTRSALATCSRRRLIAD